MFSNFLGWSANARGIGRDAPKKHGRDDDRSGHKDKDSKHAKRDDGRDSGGKGHDKSRDHEKDRDDYQWGHSKSRGHEKDRDDVFDHGHDAHGNGHGYGHDKHGHEEPPPAPEPEPECTEVDENQTFVFDLDSAGELNGGTGDRGVVYAIVGGADKALFDVDGSTGELVFINAPDFETPLSADGDNSYDVVVRAINVCNPCQYVDETFKVCVQDVEEAPPPGPNAAPQIVSPEGNVVPINATLIGRVVVDVDAIDPDDGPEPITYSISGEDADFFEFDTETGIIRAPAGVELFEVIDHGTHKTFTPIAESADGDFTFEVTVTASDGLATDSIELQLPLTLGG